MPVMVCECGARLDVGPTDTDPPGTVEIHGIPCPDCDEGDKAEQTYISAGGETLAPRREPNA